MKEEYSKGLEQNLSVMQAISSLTSLSARINDICFFYADSGAVK